MSLCLELWRAMTDMVSASLEVGESKLQIQEASEPSG